MSLNLPGTLELEAGSSKRPEDTGAGPRYQTLKKIITGDRNPNRRLDEMPRLRLTTKKRPRQVIGIETTIEAQTKKRNIANSADRLSTVKGLVETGYEVFFLTEFLETYFPKLKHDDQQCSLTSDAIHSLSRSIVISPLPSLGKPNKYKIESPDCHEPLPGLVDDCVEALVRRRDKLKSRACQNGLDGRNVLIDGYATKTAPGTLRYARPGIIKVAPNDNIFFWKFSNLMKQLHIYVGDEILRLILLYTRLFIPPQKESSESVGNLISICGPPLPHPMTNGTNQSKNRRSFDVFAPKENFVALQRTSTSSINNIDNDQPTTRRRRPRKKRRRGANNAPAEAINTATKLEDTTVVSRNRKEMEPNSVISRFALFYSNSYIPKIGFSRDHPLNDKDFTSKNLLVTIIPTILTENGKKKRKKQWRRLQVHGLEVCQQILHAHRTACDYPRILERYCPVPTLVKNHYTESSRKKNGLSNNSQSAENSLLQMLGKQNVPHKQVVSFLASVLRKVFPESFWGCEDNFGQVLNTVKLFVGLRRQERLSNKVLMHGIRTTKMKWLYRSNDPADGCRRSTSKSDHQATQTLTLHVLRWLFRGFIIPLLRSVFYVTETEFSANRVLYYRKPVWAMFRSLSMRKLFRRHFLRLKESEAIPRGLSQAMGFSSLKLLPKSTGVRPIAQLSRRPLKCIEAAADARLRPLPPIEEERARAKFPRILQHYATASIGDQLRGRDLQTLRTSTYSMPTNSILQGIFEVLKYECSARSHIFGSGLESLSAFYPRYHKYVTKLKQQQKESSVPLNLVFASVDIEKCYDNINQPFMYDLAKRILSHDDYIIQQFNLLQCPTIQSPNSGRVKKKAVGPPERYRPLYDGDNLRGRGMILEPGQTLLAKPEKLLDLLFEHLHSNLLILSTRFGNKFLVQKSGIPQGSVLSMLLCNLYYGEIEKMIFSSNPQSPREESSKDMMARLVDDFIFISTSRESVSNFLHRMWEGRPELGAVINRDKVQANTSLDIEEVHSIQKERDWQTRDLLGAISIPVKSSATASSNLFPWCGMLFDADTGEVSVDYSRFPNDIAKDSLTVDRSGSEGQMFLFRMKTYVRPRCIPLLYDSSINSKTTIISNFFHMMLFAALKTGEYLKSSSFIICGQEERLSNLPYILASIDTASLYAQSLIGNSLRSQCPNKSRNKSILTNVEAMWLSWNAFHMMFKHMFDPEGELVQQIADSVPKIEHGHSRLAAISKRAFRQFQLQGVIV